MRERSTSRQSPYPTANPVPLVATRGTDNSVTTKSDRIMNPAPTLIITLLAGLPCIAGDYDVVDTNQSKCYDNSSEITAPAPGQPFHGQDAQHDGSQPAYVDNGDGTVTDLNTGLMWQQTPSPMGYSWQEAVDYCDALTLAGSSDWRIPSLKELFSIGDFSQGWPYFDETYFDIAGSTVSKDEQFWASDFYVGTTHGGAPSAFGVNHGTGHIKAYPAGAGGPMGNYVRAVRGASYGTNAFVDNGDGTVTDTATGLMWQAVDSGATLDWENALSYAENLTLAGHDDWRLPDVKELQGIVDYSRSPNATNPANLGPAIDTDFFTLTELPVGTTQYTPDYGYFWSSTSCYFNPMSPGYYYAWYVAFGTAPDGAGADMHGAGAVRFDTKVEGGPSGEGGERYYNYVLCVRDDVDCDGSAAVYCTAKTTTSGCFPAMEFSGAPSATASSGFTITAKQVEADQFGIFFYGTSGPQNVPFLGGTLCLQGPFIRTAVQNSGSGGVPPCTGVLSLDLNQAGICAGIGQGNQGWIQGWFRDPPDANGVGLTDAVTFTVCP